MIALEGARLSVPKPAAAAAAGAAAAAVGAAAGAAAGDENGKLVLLDGLSYSFTKGERVGIVGRNGAGKTSFLRAFVGEQPLSEGLRSVGETVRIGYYDQRGLQTAGLGRTKLLDYVVSQVA